MKVLVNLLKFILITIISICVIGIGIINIFSSTILDKNYVIQKLDETNFYSEMHKLVESNFENYIYQSGLDEEILENICSEEKLKNDINLMISNLYDGTDKKIDTTEIKENLNSNIDKLDIKNSKNEKSIEQFVNYISNEYTDTLVHTKYETQINDVYKKVVQTLEKINEIIIIVLIVSTILVLILNNKKIFKNIQSFGIALLSAGAFELILINIINSKINIAGIKVFNDAFSNTIVTIIQNILEKVNSLGDITLIISLLLIIIYSVIVATQKKD